MSEQDERDPAADSGENMEIPARRRRNRPATDGQSMRRGLLTLVPLVMIGVVGVVVMLQGLKDGPGAYHLVGIDQLVHERAKFEGRKVRAEGNLVHGSLTKRDRPCEYRFTIAKNGVEAPVRYPQCVVPDTFRDVPGMDVSVTVEGELLADNSFAATSVIAKCPSKYEMNERAARGETMPHAPIPTYQ